MDAPVFERLIHVPGQNPIIRTEDAGERDDSVIGAAAAFKDADTHCLCDHGVQEHSEQDGQRAGHAGRQL